jgi:hypothetical protein
LVDNCCFVSGIEGARRGTIAGGSVERFGRLLTFGGSEWYETLPWIVGSIFLIIEMVVRAYRKRKPLLNAMALTFAFGEGVSLATIATCAPALAFNKQLALALVDKNGKIMIVALLLAFFVIVQHLIQNWTSDEDVH